MNHVLYVSEAIDLLGFNFHNNPFDTHKKVCCRENHYYQYYPLYTDKIKISTAEYERVPYGKLHVEPNKLKGLSYCDIGNVCERLISAHLPFPIDDGQKAFKKKIADGWLLFGRVDGMYSDDIIFEIKTQCKGDVKLKPAYIAQLQLYLHIAGKQAGMIIIYSLTSNDVVAYVVKRNDALISTMLSRLADIVAIADN
jgi:hypothetical protein